MRLLANIVVAAIADADADVHSHFPTLLQRCAPFFATFTSDSKFLWQPLHFNQLCFFGRTQSNILALFANFKSCAQMQAQIAT